MTRSVPLLAVRAAMTLSLLAAVPLVADAGRLVVQLSDSDGQALADGVVVARPVGSAASRAATRDSLMVQQGQSFNPAVLVVPAGARVGFPNRDRMRHHIYSFSEAKRFEVRLYSGEETPTLVFDKPGIITLGCNIHDWMQGYIYVADSPYFAVSDQSGAAVIDALPDASYELVLWHPGMGDQPVVRPGLLQVTGDLRLAEVLPAARNLVAQAPADDDPLTAKFRRRPN